MAAQKTQKKNWQKFLHFFLPTKKKNSLDSSRPYARLLENPKTWGYMKHFCPKIIATLAPQ